MEILLTANTNDKSRRIGWISLQPDGSVSVGLNDKSFISPDFKAKNFVWSAYNRVTLQYLVQSDPSTLTPVKNPHLTFHPPIYFHLKSNQGKTLYEGIGDLNIMLDQDGVVPWIRFISKPVFKLCDTGLPRRPDRTRIFTIKTLDENCSVGLGIDFVRKDIEVEMKDQLLSELIEWNNHLIHIHASLFPAQIATLSWFHQK